MARVVRQAVCTVLLVLLMPPRQQRAAELSLRPSFHENSLHPSTSAASHRHPHVAGQEKLCFVAFPSPGRGGFAVQRRVSPLIGEFSAEFLLADADADVCPSAGGKAGPHPRGSPAPTQHQALHTQTPRPHWYMLSSTPSR